MKYLFIISFLLFSHYGFSQEKYYLDEYQYYELLDSVNFRYGQDGWCGSAASGKGKYKIKKNKIYFTFSSEPTPLKNVTITPLKNSTSEILVNIIIYEDSLKNPLPFVNVYYEDTMGYKIGTSTDINGIANLKIDNQNFRSILYFQYIGMHKLILPIEKTSQKIEYTAQFHDLFEIFNETRIFKINRRKKKLNYL